MFQIFASLFQILFSTLFIYLGYGYIQQEGGLIISLFFGFFILLLFINLYINLNDLVYWNKRIIIQDNKLILKGVLHCQEFEISNLKIRYYPKYLRFWAEGTLYDGKSYSIIPALSKMDYEKLKSIMS